MTDRKEKKRNKRNDLIIMGVIAAIMAIASIAFVYAVPMMLSEPSSAFTDPVPVRPEWENQSSYDVAVRPFPWIDVERDTIENPISNEDFLKKVDNGSIHKVRYVINYDNIKLYGYEEERGYNSSRWDLYSTELVPKHKLDMAGGFSNPNTTPQGIVFLETSSEKVLIKMFFLAFTAAAIIITLYMIGSMIKIYRDNDYETKEEVDK